MTTARWGGRALALAAVALATFAVAASAPNQPKKNDGDNEVYFGGHPAEWVCYDAPYELTVHYTAAVNNLEVTIDHPGSGTKTKAAPKGAAFSFA